VTNEAEALKYLVETVGPTRALDSVQAFEFGGLEFVAKMGTGRIELPPPEPLAAQLRVVSLGSFCAYIEANRDALALEKQQIIVMSPIEVALVSALTGRHRQRETPLAAYCPVQPFRFGEPLSMVDFIVGVRTRFEDLDGGGDRAELLELVSAVKSSESAEFLDTGAGQEVLAHRGLELKERRRVTEPFLLYPFRAFPEVESVGSPFILRLSAGRNGEPCAALHECDGGAWEIRARANIAAWVRDNLNGGAETGIPILY
jgi:hypothetical protein